MEQDLVAECQRVEVVDQHVVDEFLARQHRERNHQRLDEKGAERFRRHAASGGSAAGVARSPRPSGPGTR
jgi:hypothetical protein